MSNRIYRQATQSDLTDIILLFADGPLGATREDVPPSTDATRTDADAFYKRLGFTPAHTGMELSF